MHELRNRADCIVWSWRANSLHCLQLPPSSNVWSCKSNPQVLLSLPKENRCLFNYSHSPFSLAQTHFNISRYLLYHEGKPWQFWQEMLERAGSAPYLMGMLLRVHVISGSGYDSTTQTNLATSSTSASTVSRGVLIKGAVWRKWKCLKMLKPPGASHTQATVSLQGHPWLFPQCRSSLHSLQAFAVTQVPPHLQLQPSDVCIFPRALSIGCKTERPKCEAAAASPVHPVFLTLLSPKVHSTRCHSVRTQVRLSPCYGGNIAWAGSAMNSMQIEAKMICPWSGHSASLLKHNAWDLGFFVINTRFVPLNYFSFLKKPLIQHCIFQSQARKGPWGLPDLWHD